MIVVTAEEMRGLDERTIGELGVPGVVLMESAGRAVVDLIASLSSVEERRIAILCGPGNNGGDGFVAARHLANRGANVTVILCADEARIRGDARIHFEAMRRSGVPILDGREAAFSRALPTLDEAEVIVDALFGTGSARAIEGHLARVVNRVNATRAVRVAVDVPSGLDVDRGHPLGACIHADHTVTFALPKLGLVTSPGFTLAGALHVADIGIPRRLADGIRRQLLDEECLAPLAQPRPAVSHKGTFGHVLLIAGSKHHPGAAVLAAEAAARAGAGLVTVAAPDETERILAGRVREVSTAGLGPEPLDAEAAWGILSSLMKGKQAIAIGPGVPRSDGMKALLSRLLGDWRGPLVIDADGLNLLAETLAAGLDPLAATAAQVVVTPHPAEMARLLATSTEAVQADRVNAAERFASARGVVVVLKGARTVIASPDGRVAINPTGNPGLAGGGTGDVLTGVIAALLASGMPPFEAACAGAFLHGRAADLARDAMGEAGLLASDVIERLPLARRPR